jgi:hypothetical protein
MGETRAEEQSPPKSDQDPPQAHSKHAFQDRTQIEQVAVQVIDGV